MKYCITLMLFAMSTLVFAQKGTLKSIGMELGAQNNGKGGYLSLADALGYSRLEAGYHAKSIDFIYLHGKTSGANLMTPASNDGLCAFSKSLLGQIGAWSYRTNGILIKLADNGKKIFDGVKTTDNLVKAFDKAYASINQSRGYDPLIHGPGNRLTSIEEGDVILFKSYERDTYAIALVEGIQNPGFSAQMSLQLKVKEQ